MNVFTRLSEPFFSALNSLVFLLVLENACEFKLSTQIYKRVEILGVLFRSFVNDLSTNIVAIY